MASERMTLNEAVNLTVRRYEEMPKDFVELGAQIRYAIGELEVITAMLETSQRSDEILIKLIEGGSLDDLLSTLREAETRLAEQQVNTKASSGGQP
jgi:hypothetical protein